MPVIEKPLSQIKDDFIKDVFQHVFLEAMGNIITLDAAPTATAPLLEAGEVGYYDSNLYWRVGDTVLRFAADSETTITGNLGRN